MWHHVRSENNPADFLTQGVNPNQLLDRLQLWWQRPDCLCDPVEQLNKNISCPMDKLPERTSINICTDCKYRRKDSRCFFLNESSPIVCARRPLIRLRLHNKCDYAPSISELEQAMIIRAVQARFLQELADLKNKHRVKHDSPLFTLHTSLIKRELSE